MNTWILLSAVVLVGFTASMINITNAENTRLARQNATNSAAVFESQMYADTQQILQNWTNQNIQQLASKYCTSTTDANGNTIYTCNLCSSVNGTMTGILPAVTTISGAPLWKSNTCQSPLGEDGWQVIYNQGTGQFVIQSTSFNKQVFAKVMHMEPDNVDKFFNSQAGTTMYQQILAQASHNAITRLPNPENVAAMVLPQNTQVDTNSVLKVISTQLGGSTNTQTPTLPVPTVSVGAGIIKQAPAGSNPFNFNF